MYVLYYSPLARKDAVKIARSGLKNKVIELLTIIRMWTHYGN
jgi:hypothetical protein